MALRLRKTPLLGSGNGNRDECEEPDDPSIEFQHSIMSRLIPAEYLPRLETVLVNREWLEALAALHDSNRPLKRRSEDHIDMNKKKAVLATDLVGGAGLAIEIKVCPVSFVI
jgi:inositol-pentakisphosphate 2-kinase